MARGLSVEEIRRRGFTDWPRYAWIEQYLVLVDDGIDLPRTIEKMQASQAFYQGQINAAYSFKQNSGADYSDFTDRFDDYVRMRDDLGRAIAYMQEIMAAAGDN